jgi:hypothetical protein
MSEITQVFLVMCVLLVVMILTRKFNAWKIKRAYLFIIEDLKAQGAFDQASAVDQPYARKARLTIGVRDHRPINPNQYCRRHG